MISSWLDLAQCSIPPALSFKNKTSEDDAAACDPRSKWSRRG
jgi:hypothetical protein